MELNAVSSNQQYTLERQNTENIKEDTQQQSESSIFESDKISSLSSLPNVRAENNIQLPAEVNSAKPLQGDSLEITQSSYPDENEYKLFDPDVEISINYIKDEDLKLPYVCIGPENPNENTEYPLMVFLHGMAQHGGDEESMYQVQTPAGFINDLGLDNFCGYIICPQLSNDYKNWSNKDATAAVKEIMDKFMSEHKIGKVVLVGASMGAEGASYMARNLGKEYFDEVVYISGCDGDADRVKMPWSAYAGKDEDYTRFKNYFTWQLKLIDNANHDTIVKELFKLDKDHDNCSDFLQKLYDNKEVSQ